MRKQTTTLKFQVTLVAPKGATIPQMQQFISEAIRDSAPATLMLESDSVRVALLERKTTYA